MKHKILIQLILFIGILSCSKPDKDVVIKTYKKTFLNKLDAHIFSPDKKQPDTLRSVFIFYHGGGWRRGKPEWEYKICKHFASTGMVAMSIEYRLGRRILHISPVEIIKDAKSSIRWVRENYKELNIDTNKIVVAGFSAGGHIAACTGILNKFDEEYENLSISSIPNAMILWSAAVNTVEKDTWFEKSIKGKATLEECSPAHNIKSNLPPTIIFHGEDGPTIPIKFVKDFAKQMIEKGNRCDLYIYKDQVHRPWTDNWKDVYNKIELFLQELGYIEKNVSKNNKTTANTA